MEDHVAVKIDGNKNDTLKYILLAIVILLLLAFIIVLSVRIAGNKTNLKSSADTLSNVNAVSFNNSYIFASPVRAKADIESVRVTVFVLDDYGKGIFDKNVVLGNTGTDIVINNIQNITDETGKALFDVSSSNTGLYFIEATVDGKVLPQKVKIIFD